jgi:alpha-beta hydrolase superfamily lysophospholipase
VELFTDNKAMQSFLRCDPCRLHKATSRFLYASRRLDTMLSSACNGAIAAPTTLILAGRDRIIDNAATRGVVARLTAGSAVVEELDGCHSLEFETNPLPFLQVLEQATNHATTQT